MQARVRGGHFSGSPPSLLSSLSVAYFQLGFCAFTAHLNSVFVSLAAFATDDNQDNSTAALELPFISCAARRSYLE